MNKPRTDWLAKVKTSLPREHGAWAVLFAPLIIGVNVARGWGWPAVILLGAVFFLYVTRYPLVLWARSGDRRLPTDGWFTLLFAAGPGLFLSAFLLFKYRLWLLLPIAMLAIILLLVHLWLVSGHKERSVGGEFLGIGALTLTAPAGFYAGSGNLPPVAAGLWLLCILYFGTSVFYVRMKVASSGPNPALRRRRPRFTRLLMAYQAAALVAATLLSYLGAFPTLVLLAFLPMTAQLIVGLVHKSQLNLKKLGLTLVGHTVVFVALITFTFVR